MTLFTPVDGAALTTALNIAQLGDTITLQAGTTYTGRFVLKNKTTGSGWITIQSSNLASLPADGVRVTPADAPNMAHIQAPGFNDPAIATQASAHHFKFVGIEFVGPANNSSVTAIVALGDDTTAQSTYASVPHHIVIDRSYMRPNLPNNAVRRAIALNSAYTDITNSWIEDIHEAGSDSQAIGGWNGTGPYNIINNYLEAASENVMFGGGTHRIPGYTPSDIVIRGNYVTKNLDWRDGTNGSTKFAVKNLFELKTGRRVLVEDNIFENNWSGGQDGTAIVLKLGNYGSSTHLTTEDVMFRNNIVRHSNNAVALQGRDYAENSPPGLVRRLTFVDNVFEDISNTWTTAGGIGGNFVYMTQGPQDVTFDHNTMINGRTIVNVDSPQYPINKFVFTNNIVAHNTYGFFGDGASGQGDAVWTMYFNKPDDRLLKNVIVDTQGKATLYDNVTRAAPHAPNLRAVNFWPTSWAAVGLTDQAGGNYRLAASSPYNNAATDGRDIGADIDMIALSTAGATSGNWGSAFAQMMGTSLLVSFDGTNTPITLAKSGSNITVTRGATTLSFANPTAIYIQGTLADDLLQINGTITQPLTFSNGNSNGGDALKVLSATHTVPGDLASPIRNVYVTVNAGATLNLGVTQHLGSLTVNGAANLSAGGSKVIVTNGLAVAGKLNLNDNDLILDYAAGGADPIGAFNGTSYSGVQGMLASGYNFSAYDGNGIITTMPAALAGTTGLSVGQAADVLGITGGETALYEGQVVDSTAVIVKYSYAGDLNLDGLIDAADYGIIDNYYQFPGTSGYANGDFNLDGVIDAGDYGLIDNAFQLQGARL